VILSDKDDMKAVALNLMRFFEDESCGQCTPCRAGTEKAVKLMATGPWDEALLNELSTRCAMPRSAASARRPEPAHLRVQVFSRRSRKPLGQW
jgi:formate dehydrogenase